MQIAEDVQVRPGIVLHQFQRHVRRAAFLAALQLAAKGQMAHPLGRRPQVEAQALTHGKPRQRLEHSALVPGLNQHQSDSRIQNQTQIMNIVLHITSLYSLTTAHMP